MHFANLAIEPELEAERAASLGRAGRRLEVALAEWRASPTPETLEEAQTRLWYLVVQRESIGLRVHRDLYELYDVPTTWRY
ncbi:MAG: hypothetical protein JNK82_23995 [Myxococcaceae bacterium]|nr:hypothetical protein [Myxococcaceae bacterium]